MEGNGPLKAPGRRGEIEEDSQSRERGGGAQKRLCHPPDLGKLGSRFGGGEEEGGRGTSGGWWL